MAEIDHQQGHGGCDHGGNGGDAQDLGVHVLHDVAGLGPDGGGRGRTAEQRDDADGGKPCVQPAAWVRPTVGGILGRDGMLGQVNSSFAFWAKTKPAPGFRVLACLRQDMKKTPSGVYPVAVFTCAYSFEHDHLNIYGFTVQGQNCANALPIQCHFIYRAS